MVHDTIGVTRRSVLQSVGVASVTGGIVGTAGAQQDETFTVRQRGECIPVEPIEDDRTVEEFYSYFPNVGPVAEEDSRDGQARSGLVDLMADDTSVLFLYRGSDGLSLVVIHGNMKGDGNGGAITMEFRGLPSDGEWVVTDDQFDGPDAYDEWEIEDTTTTVHWTWRDRFADGGAFRGLSDDPDVTIVPEFNQEAQLWGEAGEPYTGEVTEWAVYPGEDEQRVELDMGRRVRLTGQDC